VRRPKVGRKARIAGTVEAVAPPVPSVPHLMRNARQAGLAVQPPGVPPTIMRSALVRS
jgi:hypothetical protein